MDDGKSQHEINQCNFYILGYIQTWGCQTVYFHVVTDWSWAKGKMHASGRWERSNRRLSRKSVTSMWSGTSSVMPTDSSLSLLCPCGAYDPAKRLCAMSDAVLRTHRDGDDNEQLSFGCSEVASHSKEGKLSGPLQVLILCVSALLPLLHLEGPNLPCFSHNGVGNSITIMIFVYLHWFNCLVWASVHAHMHVCASVHVWKSEDDSGEGFSPSHM